MKVEYLDSMGSDLTVVNAARVSFAKFAQDLLPKDEKLIKYLADHKHTSPFGHCFASFRVTAPIFVSRQLVKHKFLRINEESRRYISDDPTFFSPWEWRQKSEDKKQGSGGPAKSQYFPSIYLEDTHRECLARYKKMLQQGVCEEQARMVLPLSTNTTWIWSGSMDAWADMCNLRCKEDAQYETQIIAKEIHDCCSRIWPISWNSLCGTLD